MFWSGVLAVLIVVASAHLGSPDTWFEGQAGPYPVRVVVRLPGVVPGLAQIDITTKAEGITRVTAQPIIFDAGKEGAPPPDVALSVAGRPGAYHTQLWFMTPGSFSVNVVLTGPQGDGTAVVPVAAVAERQIGLYPWLGKLLLVLGALLFIGAVTILRAAATDSVTAPGRPADPSRRRAGLAATVFGAGFLALLLWGGRSWWNDVAAEYRRELYQPFRAEAAVTSGAGGRDLVFRITDSVWTSQRAGNRLERFAVSPFVPDHGKLMHLFMIRSDRGAFAHLHPVPSDSATFHAGLGRLPAGRYDVYADVVHETGFAQTMVATVDVPAPTDSAAVTDPDDAVFEGAPSGDRITLPDGATVTWEGRPAALTADEDAALKFVVRDPDGTVTRLEPYLGMAGHAVVQRTDGAVYVHLHPNGTISMVAQRALGGHRATDTIPGMLARRLAADSGMAHGDHPMFDGTLSFPYAFPKPGEYRIWVQVRRGGVVMTAPFTATVK